MQFGFALLAATHSIVGCIGKNPANGSAPVPTRVEEHQPSLPLPEGIELKLDILSHSRTNLAVDELIDMLSRWSIPAFRERAVKLISRIDTLYREEGVRKNMLSIAKAGTWEDVAGALYFPTSDYSLEILWKIATKQNAQSRARALGAIVSGSDQMQRRNVYKLLRSEPRSIRQFVIGMIHALRRNDAIPFLQALLKGSHLEPGEQSAIRNTIAILEHHISNENEVRRSSY